MLLGSVHVCVCVLMTFGGEGGGATEVPFKHQFQDLSCILLIHDHVSVAPRRKACFAIRLHRLSGSPH